MPNASPLCLFVDRLGPHAERWSAVVEPECTLAVALPALSPASAVLVSHAEQHRRQDAPPPTSSDLSRANSYNGGKGRVLSVSDGVVSSAIPKGLPRKVRMELDRHTEKSEELLASANQMASLRGSPNILQVL